MRRRPAGGDGLMTSGELLGELEHWRGFGRATDVTDYGGVPVFANEFWTARQRAAHSLHEISYRACFKPQLPRFFIERLTAPGAVVFDPFMGRGTTLLEAALLGRRPLAARGKDPAAFDGPCIPPELRCSSVAYAQYAPSSRLVRRAPVPVSVRRGVFAKGCRATTSIRCRACLSSRG